MILWRELFYIGLVASQCIFLKMFALGYKSTPFEHTFRFRVCNAQVNINADVPHRSIKDILAADMKSSMINKEKTRLAAIRSIQAAIKQKEVDDRVEVT